jgi:glyoxylase-like metal-dependent hydrolase (beta-lactamase superfamily II)
MLRISFLAALLIAGPFFITSAGYQSTDKTAQTPATVRVTDQLYVIPGIPVPNKVPGESNTTFFITEQGVVVVDTKLPGFGALILSRIKEVTPKPVTMVINTHTHRDHSGSNIEFPASIEVVDHENVKASMQMATCSPVTNCDAFLPKRTFKDRLTLFSGKDQVELYYFGAGHTNGDTWIYFPSARVLNSGDQFAAKITPSLDLTNGGNALSLAASMKKAVATVKNVQTVIPGHGPVSTWKDLEDYSRFYSDFVEMVRKGKQEGKSVDEMAKAYRLPPGYIQYDGTAPGAPSIRGNVEEIYNELSR